MAMVSELERKNSLETKIEFIKAQFGRKRLILRIILPIFVVILLWTVLKHKHKHISHSKQHQEDKPTECFTHVKVARLHSADSIELFDDILDAERQPRTDKTIFFLETRCSPNHLPQLNARQACSIESAARLNPNWDIFVSFPSPVGFSSNASMHPPFMYALKSYPNIFFRNVHMWTYARDTPFEKWMDHGAMFGSIFFVAHASDFLRLLTLYRYGGLYLDLDVIVKKSFEPVEPNFAGAERSDYVANGIMSFANKGVGHQVVTLLARQFTENYNGSSWAINGPGAITHVLQQICGTNETAGMTRERCAGFRVYPRKEFYAIIYYDWPLLLEAESSEKALALTSHSMAVHTSNSWTGDKKIEKNSAYDILAKKNCPSVYATHDDYL